MVRKVIKYIVSIQPFEKMNFKSQRNQKNHHKIPLYPPFSKGEITLSSLWKREVGRDFQSAKLLQYIVFAALIAFLVGCGAVSKEIMTKSHSERIDIFSEVKEEGIPPKGFVDLTIKASIKTHLEGYYIFESRKSLHGKPGYPFVFNIDGQGILWKAQGQKETTPLYNEKGKRNPEGGKGMRYTIEKKIRLKAGTHMVFFGLPEDKYYVEFKIGLSEGEQHVLEFKPVYSYRRQRTKPAFEYGISKYEIFFN